MYAHLLYPYCTRLKARVLEETKIQKVFKMNVMQPARWEWTSKIVFAQKKDGSPRFCIDYRKLTLVKVKRAYLGLQMDECMVSLGKTGTFWTLGASSGYWQVHIDDWDKDKNDIYIALCIECTELYECQSAWRTHRACSDGTWILHRQWWSGSSHSCT